MASYNELLALIDAYINQNGVQAITGQVLNGVLRAMVDQLGRGYAIMGAADPTTDPGTPDGPETWFASVPGTYTNFDGIQIVPGELALLSYVPSDGFSKNTIYEGFQTVQATADDNIGYPQVGVSYANGVLSFDFRNIKGEPGENGQDGDPAGFGTVNATVDDQVGTPSVSVSSSGPDTAKNFTFAFRNLKGETGVTSVLATVDNTSGNPQCTVSLQNGQLTLAFTGLKGAQGDTGSSVDYPFTIVNNLTTNDATQALSAAMGVQLESEVSQLEAKVDGKIELLAWIGASSAGKTDWQVGDKIYNTTREKLAVCTSPSPSVDFGPDYDAEEESLYIYDGLLYRYNGATLVKVDGKKDNEVDLLNEYLNGKVVKLYNVTAGTQVDGTSLSSPNAIPCYIGKGCKFSALKTSSVVSSIRIYGIDKNGASTSIGNVYATEVVFTAPVDMVAVGVYISGGNISSNGTCTLTITKDALWETQKKVEEVIPAVSDVEKDGYDIANLPEKQSFDSSDFVRADLWHSSLDSSVTYRVSMSSSKVADEDLYIKAETGFRFVVNFYNSGVYVSDTSWKTEYMISKNSEYRIKIARTTEDTSEIANINLFVSKVTFPTNFYSEFKGIGGLEYYGKKISSLSIFPNKFNCKEEILVKEYQGASVNQYTSGMVVCKGKAFCFGDTMEGGSKCTIFDLSDLSQVQVTLPWSAHNNNAQPTPFYYDSEDEYPLFLVSRGDYASAGPTAQKFYFVRVLESGGSYVFTIVKEVSYSGFAGEQYNCSWFANYEKNELYCYTYLNGSWSVRENNPITIYKFDFPSMANYDSVSLTGADIKGKIVLQDHWIMQAGLFHDGKIFIQTEAEASWDNLTINGVSYDASKGRHFLFAIDKSGYIETLVPLHGYIEQEGMCIYNGSLYMSEKFTTAETGNLCFQLVKYDFD